MKGRELIIEQSNALKRSHTMNLIFMYPRRSQSFGDFMELIEGREGAFLKEVKVAVGRGYFHQQLIKLIYRINFTLSQIDPTLYFVRPEYATHPTTGKVETFLMRHPKIRVNRNAYFYLIGVEADQEMSMETVEKRFQEEKGNPQYARIDRIPSS